MSVCVITLEAEEAAKAAATEKELREAEEQLAEAEEAAKAAAATVADALLYVLGRISTYVLSHIIPSAHQALCTSVAY